MPIVTVTNLSAGLRSFYDVAKRQVTLKATQSRTFEMPAHHVMLLERTKEKSLVDIKMSADERAKYDKELGTIRQANAGARVGAPRTRVPGRAIAPVQRMPRVDTRFLQDPKTVSDAEAVAAAAEREASDVAETEKVRQAVEAKAKAPEGKPRTKRVPVKGSKKG